MNNFENKIVINNTYLLKSIMSSHYSLNQISSNINANNYILAFNFLEKDPSLSAAKHIISHILLKMDILFNFSNHSTSSLLDKLEEYKSLSSDASFSYLNCVLFFMAFFENSTYLQKIEIECQDYLISLLRSYPSIDVLSDEYIRLNSFEEELVYFIMCYNKVKMHFSSFDDFMVKIKLSFSLDKSLMLNNTLLNSFSHDYSNRFYNELLAKNQPDISNIQTDSFDDCSLNLSSFDKVQLKIKNLIKKERLHLKTLKEFKFNGDKRENIDKKLINLFKSFLITYSSEFSLSERCVNFINRKLTPPFIFNSIEFKSINTSYLLWLFEDNCFYDLFKIFNSEENVESLFVKMNIKNRFDEDELLLKEYISTFHIYYSSILRDS